jgi:hypothetical protein
VFDAMWVVDFEFNHHPTLLPDIVCLAAHEVTTGRRFALRRGELGPMPPYDIGPRSLVGFYSGQEAELACHLALGWELPINCVDLIAEYRMVINGTPHKPQLSMLAAAAHFNIPVKYGAEDKDRIRKRILAGLPYTEAEYCEFLDYCQADADEEAQLLRALSPQAISPHAVWRGEFIKSIARMWFRGIRIAERYSGFASDPAIRVELRRAIIGELSETFPFYNDLSMRGELFAGWLEEHGIPVRRTPHKRVMTRASHLETLARDYPVLAPFAEAHKALGQLREFDLPIGSDGRLRAWFGPFMTATSRAAPPTNQYIYNLPAWMRATMEPEIGTAFAYLDYSAMEFGIAAACSGCPNMRAFYESGEPYLATATAFGADIPPGATKHDFPREREMFKTGLLACLYGIGAETLGLRIKRSEPYARRFLRNHHEVFSAYWRWSDGTVTRMIHSGQHVSRHGWTYAVRPPFNMRSLRNHPVQTMGADVLRAACIFADRLGIQMLATAHDGILIQAHGGEIEEKAEAMAQCMRLASGVLLDGFELRVGAPEIRRHGERFIEGRGERTLAVVDRFLERMRCRASSC